MSKPKNMTPEQEAEWKERQRLRRSSPEYKAKAAIRSRRYYEKPGQKEAIIAKTRAFRSTEEGRLHRNALERAALAANPENIEKARIRQKEWQATERGRALNCEKTKRYYRKKRVEADFEAFMATLESEACHG